MEKRNHTKKATSIEELQKKVDNAVFFVILTIVIMIIVMIVEILMMWNDNQRNSYDISIL